MILTAYMNLCSRKVMKPTATDGKRRKKTQGDSMENRPLTIAFTSGLVWPNIQANERAMIAMKVQNNASSFLTPKFSKKRNKNLHVIKTSPFRTSRNLQSNIQVHSFILFAHCLYLLMGILWVYSCLMPVDQSTEKDQT